MSQGSSSHHGTVKPIANEWVTGCAPCREGIAVCAWLLPMTASRPNSPRPDREAGPDARSRLRLPCPHDVLIACVRVALALYSNAPTRERAERSSDQRSSLSGWDLPLNRLKLRVHRGAERGEVRPHFLFEKRRLTRSRRLARLDDERDQVASPEHLEVQLDIGNQGVFRWPGRCGVAGDPPARPNTIAQCGHRQRLHAPADGDVPHASAAAIRKRAPVTYITHDSVCVPRATK